MLNDLFRRQVGDNGFFKEVPLHIGLMRTLAYANIAGAAGADLATITTAAKLRLTAAQPYTSGNGFLFLMLKLPLDAVKLYRGPTLAATSPSQVDFSLQIRAKPTATPAAVVITAALTGTNPGSAQTAITAKSKTAALAASTAAQQWVFNWSGSWTSGETPPEPGADMEIKLSPDGDITGASGGTDLWDFRFLYRANAGITDDELRTVGSDITSLTGIN